MLLTLRRILVAVVLSCCTFVVQSQITQHLWVGQSYTCDAASAMMGLISDVSWSSNGGYISLSGSGFYRNATITQFFYGTGSVTCSWKYRLYSGDQLRSMSKTWYFDCYDNQASITPTTMTMSVGDVEYLGYRHQYNNSYEIYADAYFSSSNPSVVTVSRSGMVTAVGPGTTYVTLYSKISSTSPYCKITVKEINPTSVSIPSSLTAYVGESQSVSATLYPSSATTTLTWYSSDNNIASVSSGRVTGKGEGYATIYAMTSNGLRSNDCTVTVKYRVPTGISLSSTTLYLPIGESKRISYTITPSNAKTTVEWTSDNPGVATVDNNGNITAKSAGKVAIKARTDNGYWAACEVTVPPMPESLEIPKKISLMYGKSRELKVVSQPTDAYLKLSWTSSDNSVVSVDTGGKVKARTPGVADVTVTASNGVSATCRVEVEEPSYSFIVWTVDEEKIVYSLTEKPQVTFSEENIIITTTTQQMEYPKESVARFTMEDASVQRMPESIDLPQSLELAYKHQVRLEYNLYPVDYDIETSLQWTSDNPEVVSVDQSGVLTARGVGSALVTVTADNGCEASCLVQVPEPVYYFVVWLQEGGFVAHPFIENPVVTYNDELLVITTDVKEVTIEPGKVKKFTINDTMPDDDPSAVETSVADVGTMYHGSDYVSFVGCRAYMDVYVYALNGVLVKTARTDDTGNLCLSLEELERGIYIIKSEEITNKILKR